MRIKKLKTFFMVGFIVFCMGAFGINAVAASASDKTVMQKIIKCYEKGKYNKAKIYNKKLEAYSREKCVANMSRKRKKAYYKTVKKYINKYKYDGTNKTPRDNPYIDGYYLTDIDNDKQAELIIILGPEIARTERYVFYDYKNGKSKKILDVDLSGYGYAVWSTYPGKKGVVQMYGAQGYEQMSIVSISKGDIKYTDIGSAHQTSKYFNLGLKLSTHVTGWDDGPVISLSDLK